MSRANIQRDSLATNMNKRTLQTASVLLKSIEKDNVKENWYHKSSSVLLKWS